METAAHSQIHEHRDDYAAKLGMWIFLFTEMFLFGILFLVYAVQRYNNGADFHAASQHLNTFIGALNTVILLASSLTITFAVIAVQKSDKKLALKFLVATLFLAVIFMVNKMFEWDHKFAVSLYPGSELMLSLKNSYISFFGLYFFMTGLHALHLLIGMVLLVICIFKVNSGVINNDRSMLLVNTTLYWHLVDLVWIFLFPMMYLIP